jgi:hypothetical protein
VSTERDARRLLVVIYRLSHGSQTLTMGRRAVMREAARVNLFAMSDEEFEAYRVESIREAHEWRQAHGS